MIEELPPREADILWMRVVLKKTQPDIGTIFGLTQATIGYRIQEGIRKLKILRTLPRFTKFSLRTDLAEHFTEIDLRILWAMYVTTRGTAAAKVVGLGQPLVSHRFRSAEHRLRRLAKELSALKPYATAFTTIRKSPGFRYEISLEESATRSARARAGALRRWAGHERKPRRGRAHR